MYCGPPVRMLGALVSVKEMYIHRDGGVAVAVDEDADLFLAEPDWFSGLSNG